MPVTLRDIAKALGVTEATVSNAINDRGKMSEETRNRVLAAVEEMGYTPNSSARRLAKNRSQTIGVIVPNIENPFYGRLVKQITMLCKGYGYHTIIADSFEDAKTEQEAVYRMISDRIEGLLISPTNYNVPTADYVPLLEQNKVKFCYVTTRIPHTNYPFVMTDLMAGTCMLVEHLLESGRRSIYSFVGRQDNPIAVSRMRGYDMAFAAKGLEYQQDVFVNCSAYDYEEGFDKAVELMESGKKVDAIITSNDFMAVGVLEALSQLGVSVPGEIAVGGYDDMFFAKTSSVPLTTVRQDVDQISRIGVDALMKMTKTKQDYTRATFLMPELVVRRSTEV